MILTQLINNVNFNKLETQLPHLKKRFSTFRIAIG
jgi:hypothetical protein